MERERNIGAWRDDGTEETKETSGVGEASRPEETSGPVPAALSGAFLAALSAAFPAGLAFLAPGLASPGLASPGPVVPGPTGPLMAWALPPPWEAEVERERALHRQRGPVAV